jgi:transcriptional regulator with XRE-family HTH domain
MLSSLLKTAIRQRGLSVPEAAREIGVSYTTVYNIYASDAQPSARTAEKVALWLGTSLITDPAITTDLERATNDLLTAVRLGAISEADAREIVNFIRWKMEK